MCCEIIIITEWNSDFWPMHQSTRYQRIKSWVRVPSSIHWESDEAKILGDLVFIIHLLHWVYSPSRLLGACPDCPPRDSVWTKQSELCTRYSHSHLLSATRGDFVVGRVRTCLADSSFCVAGPNAWNSLPLVIQSKDSYPTFCNHLKMYLFHVAFR